jgi:hypothetical protein
MNSFTDRINHPGRVGTIVLYTALLPVAAGALGVLVWSALAPIFS